MLEPHLRRSATYLYLQDLLAGAAVLELSEAPGSVDFLRARGAKSVEVASANELGRLAPGSFDVVLALDVEPSALLLLAPALQKLARPVSGTVVLGCESRDRPGAQSGVSYYELTDLLEPLFPSVTMVGQAPFAGATLVEYGAAEPEPLLDAGLVPKGERVRWYVAVAGPKRGARGYGVMQLPLGALAPEATAATATAKVAVAPRADVVAPKAEVVAAKPEPAAPRAEAVAPKAEVAAAKPAAAREPGFDEYKDLLKQAQRGRAELEAFVLDLKAQLGERDAYLAELDEERRQLGALREHTARATLRADAAEASERQTRKRLAELEGELLRARRGGAAAAAPGATTGVVAPATTPVVEAATPAGEGAVDLAARVAELERDNARLKEREADARAEAWKSLKARSEAEAAAAEVREDTVRKLKDARKLASVELMRAMEEATKKAVGLRDELGRSERERKEAQAEVKRLGPEVERLQAETARLGGEVARLEAEVARASAPPTAAAERPGDERELARAREEADAQLLALRASALRTVHEEAEGRRAAEQVEARAEARLDELRGRAVALERERAAAVELVAAERERAAQLGELVRRLESNLAAAGAQQSAAGDAELKAATAERERLGERVAAAEHEARERAEEAVRTRHALRDREREVAALRQELSQRDARLTAIEEAHPPADEVERLEADLAATRTRLNEVTQELARTEAQVERASAAAAHERARAERLIADERAAVSERNEARARAAEAESKLSLFGYERERAELAADRERQRAQSAEEEARERKEKGKQLKRELEAAEARQAQLEERLTGALERAAAAEQVATEASARLSALEATRERLARFEADLRGEAERVAHLEEALRRAAARARDGQPV